MRRALITDAAGQLGDHVVALFNAEGVSVVALVRDGEDLPDADRVVVGDARDAATMRDALAYFGTIVIGAAIGALVLASS